MVARRIEQGSLIQHMDGRQGRVMEVGLAVDELPAARVEWFKGQSEIVVLGYIWATQMEET